jgi:hypothetical protein
LLFDTVELRHLAVGDVASRYVDGELAAIERNFYACPPQVARPVPLLS